MAININISENVFNKKYYPFLTDYINRYEIYWGGRGSGKTAFILQKLLYKSIKEKRKILIMQKISEGMREGIFSEFLNLLYDWKIDEIPPMKKEYEFKVTYTPLSVTIFNGTVFHFRGIDKSEKAKLIQGYSDLFCDELNLFDYDDFITLNGSLRDKRYKNLQFYMAFNPCPVTNWIFSFWGFKDNIIPKNTFIMHSTYKDNKFLPEDYHDTVLLPLKKTDSRRYNVLALGLFQTTDKLVYDSNWEVKDFDKNEIIKQGNFKDGIALDFGFNDPCAITCSLVDTKNKILYVYDEFYQTELTNPEIKQAIEDLGLIRKRIICDNAEPKSIKELQNLGVKAEPCRKLKGNVNSSILNGILKLKEYKIYIHPKCERLKVEFENYSWQKDKNTNQYIDKPLDNGFCHLLDSLRYMIFDVESKHATLIKTKFF